jgi:hypothetical protein
MKVLYWSQIRLLGIQDINLRAGLIEGEEDPIIIKTKISKIMKFRFNKHGESGSDQANTMTGTEADTPSSQKLEVTYVKGVDRELRPRPKRAGKEQAQHTRMPFDRGRKSPTCVKLLRKGVDSDPAKDIITSCNQMLDLITRDKDTKITWKFKQIVSHQGSGETTSDPLYVIAADDHVTCAIYAKEKNKHEKKLVRMVTQTRDYCHARKDFWQQNSISTEVQQTDGYDMCNNIGHRPKAKPPPGYKRTRGYLVFDVKHNGRQNTRLVADQHITDVPINSAYSGVVSLRGFRLTLSLAELHDIWNVYLEAESSEKTITEAGPEFGYRYGHFLIVRNALCCNGARWYDKLIDSLREFGFCPCKF